MKGLQETEWSFNSSNVLTNQYTYPVYIYVDLSFQSRGQCSWIKYERVIIISNKVFKLIMSAEMKVTAVGDHQ